MNKDKSKETKKSEYFSLTKEEKDLFDNFYQALHKHNQNTINREKNN